MRISLDIKMMYAKQRKTGKRRSAHTIIYLSQTIRDSKYGGYKDLLLFSESKNSRIDRKGK